MIVELPIRSLVEYDSPSNAPLSATAGPEGSVIITYTERVEVLAEIPTDSKTLPEPVAVFTKKTPALVAKKKKTQKYTPPTLTFDQFTYGVQFHEDSNRFVSITDKLNLTSWPATHGSTLFDAVTTPVYAPSTAKKAPTSVIHSFHTSRRFPKHIIIVDHAGNPTLHAIPTSSTPSSIPFPTSTPNTILYAGFVAVKEGTNPVAPRFVTVTVVNGVSMLNMYVFHFTGSAAQPSYTHIARTSALEIPTPITKDVLSAAAIYAGTPSSSYSLCLYWQSGFWQVYNVSATAAALPNTTAAAVLTTIQSKQLDTAFHAHSPSSTSLSFVSPQHVLLSGLLQHDPERTNTNTPLPPIAKNTDNIPAKSVFAIVLETSYATVSGTAVLPEPEPLLTTNGKLNIIPLESQTFSSPALILTPTHLYLHTAALPKPSLLQVMGLAHQSAPFFASALNNQPQAVSVVAPAAASAQLVTTPSPFILPHCASATLAQVAATFVHPSASQAFVASLMQSWGKGADGEFCQHVQNQWASFATSADHAERAVLGRMFPALTSLLLGTTSEDALTRVQDAVDAKKTKKTRVAKDSAVESETIKEATPHQFILNFFAHTACRRTIPKYMKQATPVKEDLTQEDITRLTDSPLAWSSLASSALKYTGQDSTVATINVVERNHKALAKRLNKTQEVVDADNDANRISFAQPLSPLFIALVARYCLHQLQSIPTEHDKTDERLLFLLPLRVLVCSQALSARLVPGFLPVLLRLQQWSMAQEVLVAVPDLAENDIVTMLQVALDGWATAIEPTTTTPAVVSKKRKVPAADHSLVSTIAGKPLTPASAKLLVLSVIKAPLSKRFLEVELRALDISHVLILLKYLLAWTQAMWIEGDSTVRTNKKYFMSAETKEIQIKGLNKQRVDLGLKPLKETQALGVIYKRLRKLQDKPGRVATVANETQQLKTLSEVGSLEAYAAKTSEANFEKGIFEGITATNLLAPSGLSKPSLVKIIEWTAALLDSHFARIVLLINASVSSNNNQSTSAQQGIEALEIMTMLKDIITNHHTDICSETQTLIPFLKFWDKQVRGNTTTPLPVISNYSISLMKL